MPTAPGSGLAQARAVSRELGAPEMVYASGWPDPYEETPELQWPLNLRVYDRMRRQSSHVRALLRSVNLVVLQAVTQMLGSQVRPEVHRFVESELGLVPDERGRRRSRPGGVSWDPFLRHSLLHLVFGFMPFELTFPVGAPDAGVDPGIGPEVAHLQLGPRMPRSVEYIDVNPDGSLIGIRQWIRRSDVRATYSAEQLGLARTGTTGDVWPNASGFIAPGSDLALQPIPADRLVYFVNEQEGADWAGQSVLRSAYKHWLISDFLMRVDANAADRNGTGLPVVTYPADTAGARAKALRIATAVRTGDEAGVALETGYTLSLLGVQGGVHDTMKSIAYHDQAMSRGMLEMFLNLGHDGGLGHGSLGETFVDYFLLSIRALLRYLEETITEQVIRPLVRMNFGPDEAYPALVFEDPSAESTPTAAALKALADSGLLVADPAARAEIRRRYGVPEETPEAAGIPYLLPRGVTDPTQIVPAGTVVAPGLPGGPPRPTPPPNALPPGTQPAALPAGGSAVDRRGRQLSAGLDVGVALAGGIVPGRVVAVDGPHQVRVDVAGIVGAFTPGEVQLRGFRVVGHPPPAGGALDDLLGRAHRLSEQLAALAEARPHGDVVYADPGYQPDGRARYPLGTVEHVRAALSQVAAPDNRRAYTSRQLQLIEARIRAAARQLGVDVAAAAS